MGTPEHAEVLNGNFAVNTIHTTIATVELSLLPCLLHCHCTVVTPRRIAWKILQFYGRIDTRRWDFSNGNKEIYTQHSKCSTEEQIVNSVHTVPEKRLLSVVRHRHRPRGLEVRWWPWGLRTPADQLPCDGVISPHLRGRRWSFVLDQWVEDGRLEGPLNIRDGGWAVAPLNKIRTVSVLLSWWLLWFNICPIVGRTLV